MHVISIHNLGEDQWKVNNFTSEIKCKLQLTLLFATSTGEINRIKAMVTPHSPAVWPVPYACAQPYHPGTGSHGWHADKS